MSQTIASIYKIEQTIGSGGGGIVYLGYHTRLNKKIVLKEDKRSLSVGKDLLRREVDTLKNLSHTYIPQVYDFIEENGYIYTVMDYIEGESFDKLLEKGERFSQAQVIEWACQLLEALSYLHQYPPHGILHADIKPANIMLTPQNDIRLIDFNIALALGEEGAVAVGRSFGYASPEHYGMRWSPSTSSFTTDSETGRETEIVTEDKKENSKSKKNKRLLDARSDIYSMGATLYHILTGKRPAKNVFEVETISETLISKAVIDIIKKAMAPNPEERFQTAEEMLYAFRHLRENDERTIKYKKTVKRIVVFLVSLFLLGIFQLTTGLKQMEQRQNAYTLAEYSENALQQEDITEAINYALRALEKTKGILAGGNIPQVQKALTDALKVYDLSDGFQAEGIIKLPKSPLCLEISPQGKSLCAIYDGNLAIAQISERKINQTLPVEKSALSQVKYLEENKIVYAGENGITVYDIVQNKILWQGKKATAITLSADKKTIAAVYKQEGFCTIYNAQNGEIIKIIDFEGKKQAVTTNDSFANPEDALLALNQNAEWLAVSFEDGSLWLYSLTGEENIELFDDTSNFTHFEGGFSEDYFAFSGTNQQQSVFAVIDMINIEQTGGFESKYPFHVKADERGIYVQTENILVQIDPITGEQRPLVTTAEKINYFAFFDHYAMIASDSGISFFDEQADLITSIKQSDKKELLKMAKNIAVATSIDKTDITVYSLQNHKENTTFYYDATYDHDEARVSNQGETAMLFSYQGFRIYDKNGNLVVDKILENADQVYDQQYCRNAEECYLEVTYNDGTIQDYSALDGRLMNERKGEAVDLSLYEEFFTDTFRIESPLHGTPTVYDKDTGKLIKYLQKDDYLTYVTQLENYIITEYITADGQRYGLLLDEHCETLAYLPQLCDIVGEELLFDYHKGELRKTRIYHINELEQLAQQQ